MKVVVGSYVGNGTARTISVSPAISSPIKFLQVTAVGLVTVWRYDVGGDVTFVGRVPTTGNVITLGAGAFDLSTAASVNNTGVTYRYWGLADDGASNLVVGSYVGDGAASRNITTAFSGTPDLAIVQPNLADSLGYLTTYAITGSKARSNNWITTGTVFITALISTGMTVHQNLNALGVTYFYLLAGDRSLLSSAEYTGDGVDNRSIVGAGFEPEVAWAARSSTTGSMYVKFPDQGTFAQLTNSGAGSDDAIQAFEADGIQIGTHASVNTPGHICVALFLTRGAPPAPPRVVPRSQPFDFQFRRF